MKRSLTALFLLSLGNLALAQQPPMLTSKSAGKPVAPDGPLLRSAPEFAQWAISYEYADDQKKNTVSQNSSQISDPRPRKVLTTKTGQIVHEEQTCVDGKIKDVWFNGSTQYVKHSGKSVWLEADPRKNSAGSSGDVDSNPLPTNGFRKLEWITADTYAGSVAYGGGSCLVFVPGGTEKLDLRDREKQAKALGSLGTVAYIDADSRLPVAVRSEGELRSFHFNPSPLTMQTLPTDLAEQIKKGDEGRARLDQRAPRPY